MTRLIFLQRLVGGVIDSEFLLGQVMFAVPRPSVRCSLTFHYSIHHTHHHFGTALLSCFCLYVVIVLPILILILMFLMLTFAVSESEVDLLEHYSGNAVAH